MSTICRPRSSTASASTTHVSRTTTWAATSASPTLPATSSGRCWRRRPAFAWDNVPEVGPPNQITVLLEQWGQGDPQALEQLTPLVYGELHRLASRYLRRERSDHTLQ